MKSEDSAIDKGVSAQNSEGVKNVATPAGLSEANFVFAQALELISPHLQAVEERIRAQAQSFDPAVEGYVAYVAEKGGKRLRPALALMAAGATGKITSGHADLAVIVEMVHIATLVHDDIMDGAELRRGQPTANAKWGNSISVLLGDCLFAHALKLATLFKDNEICRRIAEASAEVCSGEIMQTQRRYDLKLSTADYYRIIEMKTAALFAVACELSAYLNGASAAETAALKTFGARLGTAYQIYDDCLDLAGTEEETGKTLGTDLKKGKFTLPVLLMLQSGQGLDHDGLRDLLLREENVDEEALSKMIRESGSVQAAAKVSRDMLIEGRDSLQILPASEYVSGLQAIADHLISLVDRIG